MNARDAAFDVVAVGASLGGLEALSTLLKALPSSFPSAMAIVQHRRPDAGSRLVELLTKHCAVPVREPEDKDAIEPGHVYLAPADYHLLVEPGSFSLSVDAPVCFARPSVDVLFESVAASYGPRALAIVLTSSNADGARGAAAIKAAGGRVVVQDPMTTESPAAVLATMESTGVDQVLGLKAIAELLAHM